MNERWDLSVIGRVRNGRVSTDDADWGAVESRLELAPEFAPGLTGLDQFSHAIVVFYMPDDPDGESAPERWTRRPRGRADMPEVGVFAQRGRMRPNPIGITVVPVLRLEPGVAVVRGLDAIDGTPILDVKPYVPVFDRPDDPRVPEWIERLMQGYF
jgi:tRNA (adenine37-N6)-methyltransferase